jgi:hypothetical protein
VAKAGEAAPHAGGCGVAFTAGARAPSSTALTSRAA